ncbi:hypothetical protein [Aquisphaera insulae]|uniref:hypothetical protein n=1 Tax=Aquisphaera insulae TaxID=2712864 RepID=UPI0013EB17DF|nr:hypothetical protein [Aquisphaera insulae]
MAFDLHPDPWLSASHRNVAEHLCGPFAAGAVDTGVEVAADGTARVGVETREPLLLVAPARPLDDLVMRVGATLDPDGAATALPTLEYAPYTEPGAFLPLLVPAVDPATRLTPPFVVRLAVSFLDRDGDPVAVAVPDVSAWVEARVFEGVMGKTLYLLIAETARVRRQAREIAAVRNLSHARWDALDRFGADLSVPRFADRIEFDPVKREIVTRVRTQGGDPVAEPDDEYRRRLGLYFPWVASTPRSLLETLNGPGAPDDPNRGALGAMGLDARFRLDETANEFAVAVHLVSPGAPALRANFLAFLAENILVRPIDSPADNGAHAQRFLPTARKTAVEELRARLRTAYTLPAASALAPVLADALDRVGRLRAALGAAGPLTIKRTYDPAAGSRYELGLGADLEPPATAELDAMNAALRAAPPPTSNDPEIAGLIGKLAAAAAAPADDPVAATAPRPGAEDPDGKWLLAACGLRTVHRLDPAVVYVSHLPTAGLVIQEGPPIAGSPAVALEARYHAPGDPGSNAMLIAALSDVKAKWADAGREAWVEVADADARALWARDMPQPPAARNLFLAAGLPAVGNVTEVGKALAAIPDELFEAIQLGPVLAQEVVAGTPAAVDLLRELTGLFRAAHVSAMLPLVTGPNEVTLVLAVVGLPGAGINLSDRLSSGFRWYAAPVQGPGGTIRPTGSRSLFVADKPGLTAVVALGYLRTGGVDPYEYGVGLPAGVALTLDQYEFLMNLLDRTYPLGVMVNTFDLRRSHVDLDGDGLAEPLPESVFRTFRKFQRRRQRGESGAAPVASPGS